MPAIEFDAVREQIVQAINNPQRRRVCPYCGRGNLSALDGFINHQIQQDAGGGLVVGGRILPSIAIICQDCGNIQFVALKLLLPNIEN